MSADTLDQAEFALNRGDAAGAERILTQAWSDITRAPGDAQHLMASVRMAQGRVQEAEQHMRGALNAEPNSLRHNIALGHILSQQRNDTGALEAYTRAASIDPNWPDLNVAISQSLYRVERFADAERAAQQGPVSAGLTCRVAPCQLDTRGRAAYHKTVTSCVVCLREETSCTCVI